MKQFQLVSRKVTDDDDDDDDGKFAGLGFSPQSTLNFFSLNNSSAMGNMFPTNKNDKILFC